MRPLFACLTVLLGFALVNANPPQRVRVVQTSPFLATQFGQIVVPTYGAAYNGQISSEDFKALIEEIRLMRQAFEKLMVLPNGTPDKGKTTTDDSIVQGVTVLQNNCAKCHDKSVSGTKGGPNKFTLLDAGKLAPLTTDQALECVLRIDDGSMPQGGKPLTDVETSKVFKMFRTMKQNTKKGK